MRTFPVFTYSWSILAKVESCHCLHHGHWKSLISTSHTCAVSAPRMRARSALMLRESSGPDAAVIVGATSPGDVVTCGACADCDSGREQAARSAATPTANNAVEFKFPFYDANSAAVPYRQYASIADGPVHGYFSIPV